MTQKRVNKTKFKRASSVLMFIRLFTAAKATFTAEPTTKVNKVGNHIVRRSR
jgi:hypothetical protein